MFMIAVGAFIHMRRDANAEIGDEMDACNSCKMHPIMYFSEQKDQSTSPSSY